MKIFIAGDHYFKPDIVIEGLKKTLSGEKEKIEYESVYLPFPIDSIHIHDDTVIPTGMAWDNNMDADYGKSGVREYYGKADVLKGMLDAADILVVHGAAVPRDILNSAEKLKLIGCLRGGPVNIDMEEAQKRGITVTNTPGKNDQAVAEFTIGLILSHLRHIVESSMYFLQGEYKPSYSRYDVVGMEIQHKKFGLVGFGRIGQALAKILQGFSAEVYAYDPYMDAKIIREKGAIPCELDELLKTCDIISLHARSSGKGGGPLIGEKELALMKPSTVFVNTARGTLVDYPALYRALTQGQIGSAALDVFGLEDFSFYKGLISLPNVTATPHLAGVSRETVSRGIHMIAEEIKRFIEGKPLLYRII